MKRISIWKKQKKSYIHKGVFMYQERQMKLQLVRVEVKYSSLENSNGTSMQNNAEIYIDAINYLKQGKRIEAIQYYQQHSSLTYNEIINVIEYCENNLNQIIANNKACWATDDIGKYEFCSSQEIFKYTSSNNPYNGKTEVTVSCPPLRLSEMVTSKDPTVIQNRLQNIMQKMNTNNVIEAINYARKLGLLD